MRGGGIFVTAVSAVVVCIAVACDDGTAAEEPCASCPPDGSSGSADAGADASVDGAPLPGEDGAPAPGGTNRQVFDAAYAAKMASDLAAAKWVATDGLDTNAGTQAAPFATMKKALESIAGGGEIIVRDGTYAISAKGWVNDHASAGSVPSGAAAKYTRIHAEHPFKARLIQESADYYGGAVLLEAAHHVWIDGFVFDKRSTGTEYVVTIGDENILSRSAIVARTVDTYGGAVRYGSRSLVEDVFAHGAGRYMFSGGTGGDSSPAGATVLRRVVSHLAFGPIQQPTASFSFYGSNDGAYAEVKDVLFANCYEIASPALDRGDDNGTKWAAWYHAKSVRNVRHIGCGVVDSGARYGGFRTDNYGGANVELASYDDCFVVGLTGGATAFAASSSNGKNPARHCSTAENEGPAFASNVLATDALTSGVVHPPLRVGDNGADQRFAIGGVLTRWGDPGFDQPSAMRLWEFPYEAELFELLDTPIAKPAGFFPAAVTATTNPLVGTTFTRFLFEAAGNPMPASSTIY